MKKKALHAVCGINLRIHPGELLCLLGHNGAGKSTAIGMICGVVAPTSGDVNICGQWVSDNPRQAQQLLGYCPQYNTLWPELSGIEHLRLFAGLRGRTKQRSNKHSDSELVSLLRNVSLFGDGVEHRAAGLYSGGMQRRLSVAMSAIAKPEVLVLDEPSAGMVCHDAREKIYSSV